MFRKSLPISSFLIIDEGKIAKGLTRTNIIRAPPHPSLVIIATIILIDGTSPREVVHHPCDQKAPVGVQRKQHKTQVEEDVGEGDGGLEGSRQPRIVLPPGENNEEREVHPARGVEHQREHDEQRVARTLLLRVLAELGTFEPVVARVM